MAEEKETEKNGKGSGFGKLVFGTVAGNGYNTENMTFEQAYKIFEKLGGEDNWKAKELSKKAEEEARGYTPNEMHGEERLNDLKKRNIINKEQAEVLQYWAKSQNVDIEDLAYDFQSQVEFDRVDPKEAMTNIATKLGEKEIKASKNDIEENRARKEALDSKNPERTNKENRANALKEESEKENKYIHTNDQNFYNEARKQIKSKTNHRIEDSDIDDLVDESEGGDRETLLKNVISKGAQKYAQSEATTKEVLSVSKKLTAEGVAKTYDERVAEMYKDNANPAVNFDVQEKGGAFEIRTMPKGMTYDAQNDTYYYNDLPIMKSFDGKGYEVNYAGDDIMVKDLNEAKATIDDIWEKTGEKKQENKAQETPDLDEWVGEGEISERDAETIKRYAARYETHPDNVIASMREYMDKGKNATDALEESLGDLVAGSGYFEEKSKETNHQDYDTISSNDGDYLTFTKERKFDGKAIDRAIEKAKQRQKENKEKMIPIENRKKK